MFFLGGITDMILNWITTIAAYYFPPAQPQVQDQVQHQVQDVVDVGYSDNEDYDHEDFEESPSIRRNSVRALLLLFQRVI